MGTLDAATSRPGMTVWLTGLPGAGKSTTAKVLHARLVESGRACLVFDGDAMRRGLNFDLDYTKEDRFESIRRCGEVALAVSRQGIVAIASLVSPYAAARDAVRARHDEAGVDFVEVWLTAPIETCELRGPQDLYQRARAGQLHMMTGVDDPYESPVNPELVVDTHRYSPDEVVDKILKLPFFLKGRPR